MKEKVKDNIDYKESYTINHFPTSGSNITSSLLSMTNEEKTYEDLSKKVIIQNKILKEYQSWANTLVDIISEKEMTKNHLDLGTPIQQRLEYIQNLMNENLEIKKKIIEQIQINTKLEDKIKIKKWNLNNCVKDYNNKKQNSIKETNHILEKNVQQMANELDNLLELKMEMEITINNKDINNNTNDLMSSNSINYNSQYQETNNKDNNFSSRIFQKNENINDKNKVRELYYIKKNLIEENELLIKTLKMFTPDNIKNNNKINCNCHGDIKIKNQFFD